MDITSKGVAALELLARTGIRRRNYEPPGLRIIWELGIDMPPPHFASFGRNFIFYGAQVGIGCGLGQFLAKVILGTPIAVFWPAFAAGLSFGLIKATYYAYGARKHGIPRWHAFDGSTPQ